MQNKLNNYPVLKPGKWLLYCIVLLKIKLRL